MIRLNFILLMIFYCCLMWLCSCTKAYAQYDYDEPNRFVTLAGYYNVGKIHNYYTVGAEAGSTGGVSNISYYAGVEMFRLRDQKMQPGTILNFSGKILYRFYRSDYLLSLYAVGQATWTWQFRLQPSAGVRILVPSGVAALYLEPMCNDEGINLSAGIAVKI